MYNIAFHRQQKWGLNTYLYAPKDDYKHRMFWREMYSVEEAGDYSIQIMLSSCLGQRKWVMPIYWGLRAIIFIMCIMAQYGIEWCFYFFIYLLEQLMTLIGAAKEHGIEFIYAISPGLDITFSNQKEVTALKRKLDQVLQLFVWQCVQLLRSCVKTESLLLHVISSIPTFLIYLYPIKTKMPKI